MTTNTNNQYDEIKTGDSGKILDMYINKERYVLISKMMRRRCPNGKI